MKLRFTRATLARLDAIFLRLLADNPFAAQRYRREIGRALDRINHFPPWAGESPSFPTRPCAKVSSSPTACSTS